MHCTGVVLRCTEHCTLNIPVPAKSYIPSWRCDKRHIKAFSYSLLYNCLCILQWHRFQSKRQLDVRPSWISSFHFCFLARLLATMSCSASTQACIQLVDLCDVRYDDCSWLRVIYWVCRCTFTMHRFWQCFSLSFVALCALITNCYLFYRGIMRCICEYECSAEYVATSRLFSVELYRWLFFSLNEWMSMCWMSMPSWLFAHTVDWFAISSISNAYAELTTPAHCVLVIFCLGHWIND